MSSLDSVFDRIDTFFLGKKKSETSLILLMVFVCLAFVAFDSLSPITDKKLKQTTRLTQEMNAKLVQEKSYYNSVTRDNNETFLIEKVQHDIDASKILLERTVLTNAYVDGKLKELSYLLFNDENWAKFLNSITQLAKNYSIDIKVIENKINEPSIQKIEQILNLKVNFQGNFYNTMKFMNAIEESELVVDIYDFNCTAGSKNLEGQLNIAVWGMKY